MKVFVIVIFCLFILSMLARASYINKEEYPRRVNREVDLVGLFVDAIFIVWTAVLLF